MQNMTGRVVFVTGASTGIGRAAANRFAAAGAIVVGTSRWPWRYPAPPNWYCLWLLAACSSCATNAMLCTIMCCVQSCAVCRNIAATDHCCNSLMHYHLLHLPATAWKPCSGVDVMCCRELYAMDQTTSESVKQAIDRVAVTYGRIDVLYLNAGK